MRLSLCLQFAVLALLHPSRGQVEETCAAEGEGFQCVDQEEAGKLNCTAPTSMASADVDDSETGLSIRPPPKHCSGSLGSSQTFCCSPLRPECWNHGCSRKYKGFECVTGLQAETWPKVCIRNAQNHLCGSSPNSKCSCCAPKYVECEDVGCSRRKGYQCKNEKEAKEHPVPCYQSDKLCKKNCFIPNTGSKPFSPYNAGLTPTPEACQALCQADTLCQWFNWVPASSSPSGCWLLQYAKTGEVSASYTIGWVTGPKYCKPCFCCPPEEPEKCEPTGCEKEFDGLGKCVDVKTADWGELDAKFDLSAGSRDNNTCKKLGTDLADEKDCCRCLKRKSCLDAGCKDEFKGHGICVDLAKANVAYMKKTLDLSAGEVKGKCRNVLKDDCCSCFKKITPECKNRECEAKKGKCVIDGDIPPPNHKKSFPCNETLKCHCWEPIMIEPCHDDRCIKQMKGECVSPRQKPPPGYVKSSYNCSNNEKCPCYVKKVDCPPDKICTESFGRPGICGEPVAGYVKNGYNCNGDVKCPCYVKPCEDEKCADMKGKCVNLPNKPPEGYVPSGHNCQGNQECPCYIERKKECKSEKCEEAGGKCVQLSKEGKFIIPVGYKEGKEWCDEEIKCKCFLPNCGTSVSCRKAGGFCFSKKPAGGIALRAKCTSKKCKCYRVPTIGIIQPAA